MKKTITLLITALCCSGLSAQINCQNAISIAPGLYTNMSFIPGSQVPTPVCAAGLQNTPDRGAWFKYIPAQTKTATISTDIAGYPQLDTRVHIYSGTCNNLVCVAGDDDSGTGFTSIVSFTATAGVTYYIAFDNNWNSQNFTFNLVEGTFTIPLFTQQTISIAGSYKSCVVDMNGDYLDDIVSPTASSVNILYQNSGGGFTPATLPTPVSEDQPSWSMAAGDYNKDGYNDLLYGGGGGATLMLSDGTGNAFSSKIETPIYVFSQRTNFVDINNDGNLDAFVCHDVQPNVYFLNNGSGGFTFTQGGLGDVASGGNYGSIWIDFDNDGDQDLFLAKCRGGNNVAAIDELHRNNGDGTFTNIATTAGFADYHQSWSSAWGDFDNDGDMDVMVGASSGSHKLMRNDGGGVFTNVTAGSGYDTFTSTSIEHVTHDFDNDGHLDILGGGNKIMYNNGDMTFSPTSIPAGSGPIGDLNNDGFLDIQNGNTIHLNTGNNNKWIKILLEGNESNKNGIGARVEIYGTWGKQIRDVRSGDGFEYMSSLNVHFGIGEATVIDQVIVKWPSGVIDIINNPPVNQPLMVVEGETLGVAELITGEFSVYPNPAKDYLQISGEKRLDIAKATVYDMNGRLITTTDVSEATVPVQTLTRGNYILILQDTDGRQHTTKFIKQ